LSDKDPTEEFLEYYKPYYKKKHGKEWNMYTIEKEYLLDLEDSIESIFEIDGDLGKKFDYKAKDL